MVWSTSSIILFTSINWVSEEYGITHYKSDFPTPVPERGNQPATAIKWPSMYLRLDYDCKRKISQAEKYPDSRKKSFTRQNSPSPKVFGFEVLTLDSGFKISGDTTKPGSFYSGFVHLVYKRLNQSGNVPDSSRIRNSFI